jgi:uncharacterized membrane protein YedE/YeeE
MRHLTAFIVGAIFAVGLGISGMTQPAKVIGFLDLFGSWDPTLMFVMIGAMVMYFVFYRVVRGHAPILSEHFRIPTSRQIDKRLVTGAAMFGVGWGLAGFCPGPGLASIGNGAPSVLIFVGAMVAGMYLFTITDRLVLRRPRRARATVPASGQDSPASAARAAQPM